MYKIILLRYVKMPIAIITVLYVPVGAVLYFYFLGEI